MKKCVFLLTFCTLMPIAVVLAEDIDPKKKALIDTLLEQTGQSSAAIGEQFSTAFIQQMTMILQQSNPEIDPRAYEILGEEVKAVIDQELVQPRAFAEILYPIYNRHFSNAELGKMIEINNSDIGKKMIEVMPLIAQEGMRAGETFGRELGPKIQQRVAARFAEEGID